MGRRGGCTATRTRSPPASLAVSTITGDMSNRLRATLGRARMALPGTLEVAGASALSYAGWLAYRPAGFAVAGVLALVKVYDLERK